MGLPSHDDVTTALSEWRDGDAVALISWAMFRVHGLSYLRDLDAVVFNDPAPWGHRQQTVEYAHQTWAASTAISAVDSCVAGLGRVYCSATVRHHDLRDLDPSSSRTNVATNRSAIPDRGAVVGGCRNSGYPVRNTD